MPEEPDFINDAFEIALIDVEGHSLVHTIGSGQTAFFNTTEDLEANLARGVTLDGETIQVSLAGIEAETDARLMMRLVNNDDDTESSVRITQVGLLPGDGSVPTGQVSSLRATSAQSEINFGQLSDVSASVKPEYGQTSWNQVTQVLTAAVALRNQGNYSINGPLMVAVTNISDPSVQVVNADGITPEGLPYFDFTDLLNQPLDSNTQTETGALTFQNPNEVQFTYTLVVLADTNAAPVIESSPDLEIIGGQTYTYQVIAQDPNRDNLTYELVKAPSEMGIDSETGLITWDTTLEDIANHAVTVRVSDGRGSTAEQTFPLAVIAKPPNRPPILTSNPVVDAQINQLYRYDADAIDPDQDPLTYSLVIGPDGMTVNSETGEVLWTPPPVLALGDTVLGQIGLPGDSAEFSFSGVTGQRIYLDGLQSFSGSRTTIYSPSGKVIQPENELLTLTESGNYRIVSDSSGDTAGSYGFSLIDPALLPEAPFDTIIEGQLSPGSEDDLFRFNGFEGQKIFLDKLSNSGSVRWQLLDEGNRVVAQDYSMNDLELYLPRNGEYILALQGQEAFSTVINYAFEIVTPDEISAPMSLGSNDIPDVITGRISEPGEEDFFTFEGSIGQQIYLDRLNPIYNGNLKITIESPTGREYYSTRDSRGRPVRQNFVSGHEWAPVTLIEDGLYRVRIDGEVDNIGDYSFSLRDLSQSTTINLDQEYSGTLEPGEVSHLYQFKAQANQRLFIDYQDNSGMGYDDRARWILYNSGNQEVESNYTGQYIEIVLDKDDTYTLAIEGNREEIPVEYSFKVITPDEISQPILFDTVIENSIGEKGERDTFTFEGLNGQRIALDVILSSFNTSAKIIGPSGSTILTNDPLISVVGAWWYGNKLNRVSLPEDGIYRLIIDGVDGTTDNYAFQIIDVDAAPALEAGTSTSDTLEPGKAFKFYQFTAQAGDRFYLDINTSSRNLSSNVYGPGNQLLGSYDLDQEHVFLGDGTYHILVRGENDEPIDYDVQFFLTQTPREAISFNNLTSGRISEPGQRQTYTFEGSLGQKLVFDSINGSSNLLISIKNQSDNVIYSSNTSVDSGVLTLLEAGTYTITVDGSGDKTGDFSFALRNEPSAVTLGTPVSGTLTAKELTLYEFDGTLGNTLNFDTLNPLTGAEWILYAPDGAEITRTTLDKDFSKALPATGTYLLALRNNSDVDLNYSFQANDISSPSVTSSGLNREYSGEILAVGESDTYPISAKAGTLIYFNGKQGNGSYLRSVLTGPDGGTVFSGTSTGSDYGPYRLDQTGNYSLKVFEVGNQTGSYEFELIDLGTSASNLALNDQLDIALDSQEAKVFRFSGSLGQRILLDGLNTENLNISARIIDQSGRQIASTNTTGNTGLLTLKMDGDYYVLLQSSNAGETTASFRLLDATAAAPIDLDTVVSGDFGDSKRETTLYRFTGSEGQKLFFDRTIGGTAQPWGRGSDNEYTIYTPDGQKLLTKDLIYDSEIASLPTDGEYLLELVGAGDPDSNYEFQFITPTDELVTIDFGSVISGEIREPGQTNTYTFTGTENQRLIFDALTEGVYNEITARIYSPSRDLVLDYNFWHAEPSAITLYEAGTYRVVIDGNDASTSTYCFRLLDFADATEVSLDNPFEGSVGDSLQEVQLYKFTGEAGQRIFFDSQAGSNQHNYALYAPDGKVLFTQRLDRDYELPALPTDGEYTLAVLGSGNGDAEFRFNLVTPTDTESSHVIGETITGEVSEAGETDYYTFTGEAGQILWFDNLLSNNTYPYNTSYIYAYLDKPSGERFGWNNYQQRQDIGYEARYNNAFTIALDESGTYTLAIDADGDPMGNYAFRFLDLTKAPEVEVDTEISGIFETTGQEAFAFKFTAPEGARFFFDRNSGGGQASYYLYDSSGQQVFDQNLSLDQELTKPPLEKETQYYLVIAGDNPAGSQFSFEIVTPEFVNQNYTLGDTISGEISEAGEQDWYTFEGKVGQQLYVDNILTSVTNFSATFIAPSGESFGFAQKLNQDESQIFTLQESGTYQVKVDLPGDGLGEYSFRILDIAQAEDIPFDTVVSGDFGENGRETKLYRFSGEQGDRIYFDSEGSGNYGLYRENGENLFLYQQTYRDREIVLPEAGEYVLAIAGNGNVGTFSMEVSKSTLNETPITFGETISGEIAIAGEQNAYSFTGQVGQQIFLDALGLDNELGIKLLTPGGVTISVGETHQDWGPITLTENGTYQLLIDGSSTTTGSYSFVLSDLSEVPNLELGTTSGSLTSGNSVALYQFEGSQGTTLNFDLAADQWSGANWVLYDPGNKAIATPAWNNPDFEVALPSDGLYVLAIQGNNASSVNYEFQVTDTTLAPVANSGLNTIFTGTFIPKTPINYEFSATAGTQIYFNGQTASGFYVLVRLLNPDGSTAFTNQDTRFDRTPFTLQQTGDFTLEVFDGSGDYSFQVLELPTFPGANSLEIGGTTSGSLIGAEAKVHTFEGLVGQPFYFNSIQATNIDAKLYAPNGDVVFERLSNFREKDFGPFTLSQNGQYQLIVSNAATTNRDYSFQLFDISQGEDISFGQTVRGSLEVGQEIKVYKIQGVAGQNAFFDRLKGRKESQWALYGPGNITLVNTTFDQDFEVNLTTTGEYTLIIQGGSGPGPFDYEFRFLTYGGETSSSVIIPGTGEKSSSGDQSLGSFAVQLLVKDDQGGEGFQNYQIRLFPDSTNNAPIISSEPETTIGLTQGVYTYHIESLDIDGDKVSYRLVDSPPGSLIDSEAGKVIWLPESKLTVGDKFQFTIEVNDNRGGTAQQSFTVTVEDNAVRKGFGEIAGTVWNDRNSNRQLDKGEKGTAGVQVYLDLNANGIIDAGEPVDISALDNPITSDVDETGQFRFTDLAPGTYIVREVTPEGQVQTFPIEPLRVRDDGVASAGNLSLLQPDPNIAATFIGRGGISTDGFASNGGFNSSGAGLVQAEIPTGSNVEHAYLHIATRAFAEAYNPDVAFRPNTIGFEGEQIPISWLENVQDTPPRLNFETGRADVTSLVAAKVGNGGGIFDFDVDESQTQQDRSNAVEGVSLTVIYSNPDLPERTIVVLEGGLTDAAPQTNVVAWQQPVDVTSPDFSSQLALGIQYGYQPRSLVGTQFSTVDVNGNRLSSAAGNSDDGIPDRHPFISVNSALVTVGGVGDSPENPIDPFSQRDNSDDELYTLTPFIKNGDTAISFEMANPSEDDSIFLVALTLPRVATIDSSGFYSVNVNPEEIVENVGFGNSISAAVVQNEPPVFTSIPPTEITIGKQLAYEAKAVDSLPENDWVFYDLVTKPEGMIIDSSTGVVFWNPKPDQAGSVEVIIRAQDLYGGIDLQYFQLEVVPPNSAPEFTSNPVSNTVQIGKTFQYDANAIDPDDDPITYELAPGAPAGITVDPDTGILTWTATAAQVGEHEIVLIARDDNGAETTQTLALTVIEAQANTAPQITSQPRVATRTNAPYLYQLAVDDPDGDPLTYTLVDGPDGMTLNEAGLLSWEPGASQTGAHLVTITVEDGQGGSDTQTYNLRVGNQAANFAPEITSEPKYLTNLDRFYQYQATATDPDGDAFFWELLDAPEGMVIDAETGAVSWQPELTQVGEHTITLQATDTLGAFATQTFTLKVRGTNTPPQITSTPPTQIGIEQPYRYQIEATDIEGDRITYKLGSHPNGMTIDADTGELLWTPESDQLGNHEVELLVQDRQGGVGSQTYTLVVTSRAVNQAPTITSTPRFWADVANGYQYQLTASDPNGDILTYSVLAGPTGMTVDAATGSLQWQPTLAQLGEQTVTVAAFDPFGLGGLQTYKLQVAEANQAPVIRSTPILTTPADTTYRYDVWAADPDGEPITLSLNEGPEGMVMDELGRITWTVDSTDIGTYPIQIAVTDTRGAVTLQTFDLVVQADTVAPRVNLNVSAVQANIGDTVTLKVSASDNVGVEFLTLAINGEAIALDSQGLATVTLNEPGEFEVVATATDAAGNSGTATSTLFTLDPTDPEAPFAELLSLEGGEPFNTPITAPTGIIGTVTDDNWLFYTLAVAPLTGGNYTEIYRGTGAIENGILGNFDPTTLLNDTYRLRLSATDAGGNTAYDELLVDVEGELKLGNFQLSFTDLSIPVSGIPIQVTRTYDSLTANTRDDFGYGWRMEFSDTDLHTSLGPDPELEELDITSKGFRAGEKVYVTLPGGQREAFTFTPKAQRVLGFTTPFYTPAFEAEDGSTHTLTVKTQGVSLRPSPSGEFYSPNGFLYNPAAGLLGFGGYYELTTKEGIVYRIDGETGDLETITDRNNNNLTFTDSDITSSTGQKVTFERDAQNRITAVIDPEGNRITYEYDTLGDLVAVTDREGNATRFDYNDDRAHYLEEIMDPLGRSGVRSEYDDQGRLTRMIDADGNPVELIYDPDNDIQQVRDQLGNITTYEYDDRGNVVSEVDALGGITRRTYDADNNMLTETDPLGNTTTMTYDADGNVLTETDALGNTTRYTYDANGNVLTTTDPTGQTITNTYDANGNLTKIEGQASGNLTFTYDAYGNLTSMQECSCSEPTTFEYDRFGNITRQTDAQGTVTSYTYDPSGNRTSETTTQTLADGSTRTLVTQMEYDDEGRVIRTIDAEGGVTETIYDAVGNRVEAIDALGRSTKYVYDDRGQLIATIYPDSTPNDDSDNPRTRTEYDAKGQVIAEIDELGRRTVMIYDALGRQIATLYPDATPNDDSDNPRTQTVYDAAGRVVAEIDELGNRTEFRYDAAGRVIETILPDETPGDLSDNPRFITAYDAAGRQLTQTDALGQVTQFLYDDLGRPVGQVYADGTSTSVEFDNAGRVAARTDQAGLTTRYEYDALGRLTAVVDALDQRTEYTYDEQGNLITQTDANGNTTRYEYDRLGRRVATELPLGERATSTYDAVGNMRATTDFNGDTKTYTYDERNRLIAKDLPGTEFDETHTYTANGLRQTVTDDRGTTTYQYDERNRLISRIDPDGTTIAYTYDAAGNRTSVQIPSGTTEYGFDAQNRLQTVTDPEGGVTTYTYNPVGNLERTEFPNGTVEIREYDELNRLVYIETSGPEGVIASFRYTLDDTGNRTAVEEHDGRRVDYEYDDLYRLTAEIITDPGSVGPSRIIEYVYDAVGNRLSRTDTGEGTTLYTYDDNDRLLTATTDGDATTYTYDNNGNTTSKTTDGTTITYTWNADNRLIGADTDGDGAIDVVNQYNENGIRVSQTVNGAETRFLIDANRPYAQVLEEYTPGGIIKVSYVHGNDLISQNREGEKSFYHVDGLGSTRALSDQAGVNADQYIYDTVGQIIEQVGETENSYLFAGEQYDQRLDLSYLRARFLNEITGRFVSRDYFEGFYENPISLNKYLYADSNPINKIDPTGLFSLPELNVTNWLIASLAWSVGWNVASYAMGGPVYWEGTLTGATFTPGTKWGGALIVLTATSEVRNVNGVPTSYEGQWVIFGLDNNLLGSKGIDLTAFKSTGTLTTNSLFIQNDILAKAAFSGPASIFDASLVAGVGYGFTYASIGSGIGNFRGPFIGAGSGPYFSSANVGMTLGVSFPRVPSFVTTTH
jgi:RHS repeat-associated protein